MKLLICKNFYYSKINSRDTLIFEILDIIPNVEQVVLGKVELSLFSIEKQEEYEITFDILDDVTKKKINTLYQIQMKDLKLRT